MTRNHSIPTRAARTPRTSSRRDASARRRFVGFGALLLACLVLAPPASAQNIQYTQGSGGSSLINSLQIPLGA